MTNSSPTGPRSTTGPARVVVTGAASGIGLAIAKRFLASGARVWIGDISHEAVASTTAETPGLSGLVVDVADPETTARAIAAIERDAGGVDVIVNNAGIPGPRGPLEGIDIDGWRRTLEVNVTGAFNMIRAVTPGMKKRGAGCIINISTSSARTGLPNRLPYVVSKAALHGLTLNVARELGPFGIRCNALLPGAIDNPRGRRLVAATAEESGRSEREVEAEMLRFVSMRTWIDPDEVAEAALFLASPAARHISGQFIGVCGNVEWE